MSHIHAIGQNENLKSDSIVPLLSTLENLKSDRCLLCDSNGFCQIRNITLKKSELFLCMALGFDKSNRVMKSQVKHKLKPRGCGSCRSKEA